MLSLYLLAQEWQPPTDAPLGTVFTPPSSPYAPPHKTPAGRWYRNMLRCLYNTASQRQGKMGVKCTSLPLTTWNEKNLDEFLRKHVKRGFFFPPLHLCIFSKIFYRGLCSFLKSTILWKFVPSEIAHSRQWDPSVAAPYHVTLDVWCSLNCHSS